MLSDAFASVLRAGRPELNARFAEARHRLPALDPGAFGDFLRDGADAVVRAVHALRPDRAGAVALAAFDIGLDLVGQQVAGPTARGGAIDDTWRRVLPAAARSVAAEPERVIAALSNAAHQVAATPGARVSDWIADMERLAPQCASADDLLRLGQVAAWRAGLAHYRLGAIAAAASLPESLALAAVGASTPARWSDVEAALRKSEWFDPAHPSARSGHAPSVAATAGAFRGFGGPFTAPPRVTFADGHFHVLSGDECWLLTADLYGATFHRLPPEQVRLPAPGKSLPRGLRIDDDGSLAADDRAVQLYGPGTVTSAAASDTTLAVTWTLTHRVTLVSLT